MSEPRSRFSTSIRGYNTSEVDRYVELLTRQIEDLEQERGQLLEELERLRTELDAAARHETQAVAEPTEPSAPYDERLAALDAVLSSVVAELVASGHAPVPRRSQVEAERAEPPRLGERRLDDPRDDLRDDPSGSGPPPLRVVEPLGRAEPSVEPEQEPPLRWGPERAPLAAQEPLPQDEPGDTDEVDLDAVLRAAAAGIGDDADDDEPAPGVEDDAPVAFVVESEDDEDAVGLDLDELFADEDEPRRGTWDTPPPRDDDPPGVSPSGFGGR